MRWTTTLLAAFNDNRRAFTDDYNKGIGTVAFNITALTPDLDGDGDGDFIGGAAGGLTFPVETRLRAPADTLLATDRSSSDFETTSFEARIQFDFDGPFNFTAGALKLDSIGETNYFVFFNTAEALGIATGLPGDRTYFLSRSPYKLKALGAFGEAYYNVSDDLKLTLGLRYTDDQKRQENTPSLLLAPASVFPGEINGFAQGGPAQEASFEEVTGRVGFDLNMDGFMGTDDTLLYGFLSRGYKGGGINPPQSAGLNTVKNTFDPEFINSIEIGTKSSLFGSKAVLNLAAFYYDYEGYQISSIVNRSSINENVDATIFGFEGEFYWQATDNFRIDTTWGLLDAELANQAPLVDTYDQTGGDPDWIVAKNLATTQNCIVDRVAAEALIAGPFAGTALVVCDGVGDAATGVGIAGAIFGAIDDPNTTLDDAGNAAFANGTAAAIAPTVREANPVDVSGNRLPRAPKATLSIGAEYEMFFDNGWTASLRGDFYYQADMFTRIFNLEADRIESWQNVNAAFTLRNEDKGLEIEFYGKNLISDDQITNQYLTDASSGLFTNTFLLEPRQFGVRVAKSW